MGQSMYVFAITVFDENLHDAYHIDCGEGACDQAGRVRAEPSDQ